MGSGWTGFAKSLAGGMATGMGKGMREDRLAQYKTDALNAQNTFTASESAKVIAASQEAAKLLAKQTNKRNEEKTGLLTKQIENASKFRLETLAFQRESSAQDKAWRKLKTEADTKGKTATAEWRKSEQTIRAKRDTATEKHRNLVLEGHQSDRANTAEHRKLVLEASTKAAEHTSAYRTLLEGNRAKTEKFTADHRATVTSHMQKMQTATEAHRLAVLKGQNQNNSDTAKHREELLRLKGVADKATETYRNLILGKENKKIEQTSTKIANEADKVRVDRLVDANTTSSYDPKLGKTLKATDWLSVAKTLGPEETEKLLGFGSQGASKKNPYFSSDQGVNDVPAGSIVYDEETKRFYKKNGPSNGTQGLLTTDASTI